MAADKYEYTGAGTNEVGRSEESYFSCNQVK